MNRNYCDYATGQSVQPVSFSSVAGTAKRDAIATTPEL
jgi:hypothetical protein